MSVTAVQARDRLIDAATTSDVQSELEALGVDLLGVFGSAASQPQGTEPKDLDIAARFSGPVRLHDLIDALVRLTGFDRIDVAVVEGRHPVLDAEALCGIPLYERVAGSFAEAQMAALAHRRDTAPLRELDLEALAG
jgi:predicted nucleotidyltransferase